MAAYASDFSEYVTGNQPNDWTARWVVANVTYTVEAAAEACAMGKKLYIDNNAAARHLISCDDMDGAVDVDIIALVKTSVLASGIRICARASGAAGSEYSYVVAITATDVNLFKYVNGVSTGIGTVNVTLSTSGYYWIRFKLSGTSLKVKLWEYDQVEPYHWILDDTDSDISSGGWIGISSYAISDSYCYYFAATDVGNVTFPVAYKQDKTFGCINNAFYSLAAGFNGTRIIGGYFQHSGRQLTGVKIWVAGTHTSQFRLAVYRGGALNDPSGATLLHDFGLTTGAAINQWLTYTCSPINIAANDVLWFALKGNDGNFHIRYTVNPATCGNYQIVRGRYASTAVSSDETVAYPNPWPADSGSFADYWFKLRILLDDESITTVAPTTLAPTTLAPTTAAPTTAAPTTLAPTTVAPPTTAAPTTSAPTTAAPTLAPTTIAPTTAAPTAAPTTLAPTTAAPTAVPTTLAPTTAAPEEICIKELNSIITKEFLAASFIAKEMSLRSVITKEIRLYGNLC